MGLVDVDEVEDGSASYSSGDDHGPGSVGIEKLSPALPGVGDFPSKTAEAGALLPGDVS